MTNAQLDLTLPPQGRFNGDDYVPARDDRRLRGQQLRVFEAIRNGQWRSLSDIAAMTGDPEASISAQLRHLRKPRFGSHTIEKRYIIDGLYEYRLLVNGSERQCSTRNRLAAT